MIGALLYVTATFLGGTNPQPPPPPAVIVLPAVQRASAPEQLPSSSPLPPLARPGHYACTGDDNAAADCVNDEPGPAHIDVNPGSDQPAGTLGETNRAYGARLTAELCEAKPEFCG